MLKNTLEYFSQCVKYNLSFAQCGKQNFDFPLPGKKGLDFSAKLEVKQIMFHSVQSEYRAVIALKGLQLILVFS